ncbi:XRE family transcriptional regulator [Enterococcus larvae]|uniref:XRE family transcriptional regulator n=1 Tax=Enterococcus larvae TaxID=2794352 RepID=UPI003F2FEC35
MLKNLETALSNKKITRSQVATVLGYAKYTTITEKLEGKTKFDFDEAVKLRQVFFPEYDLEFLFMNEKCITESKPKQTA